MTKGFAFIALRKEAPKGLIKMLIREQRIWKTSTKTKPSTNLRWYALTRIGKTSYNLIEELNEYVNNQSKS